MRVGELCGLEADAVVLIGDTHWLRIPVGKLHNDRYIPLHPQLVEMLAGWAQTPGAHTGGLLLTNDGRPLNRHAVTRMLNRITKKADLPHVHPHQLRHTLATQAINRGMSLEAIAALLGHRSLDMTMTYARIADRTVADEYFAVTDKVEALYGQAPQLPADAEGPNMAKLRREHHRMLGNGYCTRPVELDCAFETICETCTYFDRHRVQTHPARPSTTARPRQGPGQPRSVREPAQQPRQPSSGCPRTTPIPGLTT